MLVGRQVLYEDLGRSSNIEGPAAVAIMSLTCYCSIATIIPVVYHTTNMLPPDAGAHLSRLLGQRKWLDDVPRSPAAME